MKLQSFLHKAFFHSLKTDKAFLPQDIVSIRAATILRLLGNKMNQFNTRVKKSEPGLRKQLKIDVKTISKLDFSLKYEYIYMFF